MKAKRTRNLIIMGVVLVLLIGVLVLIQIGNKKDKKDDGTDTVTYTEALTSFKESEISKVSYQYRDGEKLNYKLIKDIWYNADDEDFPLSSTAFSNNFVTKFVAARTSREVEDADSDDKYGLDDPYLTLEVENLGGVKETFYIGDYNSMLQEYYLKIEGKDKIYTVNTDLLYVCREDMYDYANVESFPAFATDTLNDITINNDGLTVKMVYMENGSETDLIGTCKWFFSTPFLTYRSAETNKIDDLQSDTLDKLQFSKLVNYKATKEDLDAYGLTDSKRQYIINYRDTDADTGVTQNASKTVDFGAYDEATGCYYARITKTVGNAREVSGNVYLISKASAEAVLGIDPLDYIYKQVIYIKLSDIAAKPATSTEEAHDAGSIVFTTPDGEYTLLNKTTYTSEGKTEQNLYEINGKEVDEEALEDFYFDILSKCGVERIIYDQSTVVTDQDPVYTIVYNRQIDDYYGNVTVQYTTYDLNYYQVTVNGKTDILVNKRIMDETMAQLAEMTK